MNLCNNGHDEVCFEGKTCPCCYEIQEREERISELENEINCVENEREG